MQEYHFNTSESSFGTLGQIERLISGGEDAILVGADGSSARRPTALAKLLGSAAETMQRSQAVLLFPANEPLTTQAAEFLNTSRRNLLRLHDAGKIPFHRGGSPQQTAPFLDVNGTYERKREKGA